LKNETFLNHCGVIFLLVDKEERKIGAEAATAAVKSYLFARARSARKTHYFITLVFLQKLGSLFIFLFTNVNIDFLKRKRMSIWYSLSTKSG